MWNFKDRFAKKESMLQIRIWPKLEKEISRKAKIEGIPVTDWIRERLIEAVR